MIYRMLNRTTDRNESGNADSHFVRGQRRSVKGLALVIPSTTISTLPVGKVLLE